MIELLMFWLISGIFGGTYLSVLFLAFFIIKANRQFVVSYFNLSALLIPIAIYLILTHVVDDRQGFNWGYANLMIAFPAVITLYLSTWRPAAYWIGLVLTIIIAFAAWWLVPMQGLTKLF